MAGSRGSFTAFWRTLVYNRGPHFDPQLPNLQLCEELGISLAYWYLTKKLAMKRLWQQDILRFAVFSQALRMLAEPFETAEGKVRDARRLFVSKDGRLGCGCRLELKLTTSFAFSGE